MKRLLSIIKKPLKTFFQFLSNSIGMLIKWGLLSALIVGLFTVYTDNQDFLKFTVEKGFLAFQDQGIECNRLGQVTLDNQNEELLNSYYNTYDNLDSDIPSTMYDSHLKSNIGQKNLALRIQSLEQKIINLNNQNAKAFEAFQECTNSMIIKANTTASLLGLDQGQLCPIQKSYYAQLNLISIQKRKMLSGIGATKIQSFYFGNNPTENFWENIQNEKEDIHSQLFIYKQQLQPQKNEIDLANAYFDRMKTILLIQMNLLHHQTLPVILKSIFINDEANENNLKSELLGNLSGQSKPLLGNCK